MDHLTNVAQTEPFTIQNAATAVRFDGDFLHDFIGPVILFDHVKMRAASFPPHPHAGLCIFSYVLDDSPGSLRDRDSLNPEIIVEPGDLLWFQMARGMIHEENPAVDGEVVHQMQVWIPLSADKQDMPPATFLVRSADVPEVYDDSGSRIRVVLGGFGGKASPLIPTEPFSLLDISLTGSLRLTNLPGCSAILYVLAGEVVVSAGDERRRVRTGQVVGARENADLVVRSDSAQLLFMAKPILDQPLVMQGMYAMHSQEAIDGAKRRFHRGEFGDVPPYAKVIHPDRPYVPAGQDPQVTVTPVVERQATVRHYDEGWWKLHFQYCRFEYSDYEIAHGYRFVWEDPDGREAPYRFAGYIPYMEYFGELLAEAAKEGWADLPYRDSF